MGRQLDVVVRPADNRPPDPAADPLRLAEQRAVIAQAAAVVDDDAADFIEVPISHQSVVRGSREAPARRGKKECRQKRPHHQSLRCCFK